MITNRDQLIDALANTSSRIVIDKASIANAAVGQYHSLWRATGQPGPGAIPAAAAGIAPCPGWPVARQREWY